MHSQLPDNHAHTRERQSTLSRVGRESNAAAARRATNGRALTSQLHQGPARFNTPRRQSLHPPSPVLRGGADPDARYPVVGRQFFRPHHAHRPSIKGDSDAVIEVDKSRNNNRVLHFLDLELEMALIDQTCVCRTPAPPKVLMRSL